MATEQRIKCERSLYYGMVEEGSKEGIFEDGCTEYVGQFRHGMSHGKGVWRGSYGSEEAGDWRHGWQAGYGEWTTNSSWVPCYKGQRDRGTFNGYGEHVDSDDVTYQGFWINGSQHGMVRCISDDGGVKDTIWEHGTDTGTQCNADDVVAHVKHGKSLDVGRDTFMFPLFYIVCI